MYSSLVNQLFANDNNTSRLLLGSENFQISEWLKRHREAILPDLISQKNIKNYSSKEDYESYIGKLYDLTVSLIAKSEISKDSYFTSFIIELDLLIKRHLQIETNQIKSLFDAILLSLKNHLQDRELVLVEQKLQEIFKQLQTNQLLQNHLNNISEISQKISHELLQLNINRRWKINATNLQQSINTFLNDFLTFRCDSSYFYSFHYCLCFVKNFITNAGIIYSDFLELLIIKLDRELIEIQPTLFNATEVLLGSIDRFDFINLITTRYSTQLAKLSPIDTLMLLRVLLDSKQDSQFNQIWILTLNPSCLSIDKNLLIELKNNYNALKDLLRNDCERLQLDWLNNAFEYLYKISSSLLENNNILQAIEPDINNFIIKISEGLTDNTGIKKLTYQLCGIFVSAHYSVLISPDILSCKSRFRYQLAKQLAYESNLVIWKKYKQISLALAQLDINIENIATLNLSKTQNICKELDNILSDSIRASTIWWPNTINLKEIAEDYHGCQENDLELLLVKLFIYKKLFGSKSNNYLINHLSTQLSSNHEISSYSKIRKVLSTIYDQLAIDNNLSEFTKILGQFLSRLHEATSAKNINTNLAYIIDSTTNSGTKSFANTLREHPEWTPPGGNDQAWQLGRQDNFWLLKRLSLIFSFGLSSNQQQISWWFSVGVAKHIRAVPLKFLSANLNALSQALFDSLSSDEALAILNIIKALYRSSFGIETDIYENSPDMYVPSMITGKVWHQIFRTNTDKKDIFQKHIPSLVACAPNLLETVAEHLPLLLTKCGDEEYAWQQLYPHYYALIETHGAVLIEDAWYEWQTNILNQLPTGSATYWFGLLTRALEPIRQIALALQLRKNQDKVREYMAVKIADERIQVNEAAGLRSALLSSLLQKISLHLMTDSPSLAALNIGRYLVFEGNNLYGFSTRTWRLLWLGLDESLRNYVNKTETQALDIWSSQWLAITDLLPKVKNFSDELFNNKQLVFADTYEDEMQWREAISGIIASALTPNAVPYSGGRLVQRLVLGSSIFARENPASWNERRLGLENVYSMIKDPILRGRLTDRHSQIATVLFNRERLLEAGNLQPSHQYSLMFSEFNWAKHLWRFVSLTRQLDEGRMGASYDDSIIANLSHELPPNNTQVTNISEQMKKVIEYEVGQELVKKRWLSSHKITLNKVQSESLKLILCLTPLQEILPAQVIRTQISHLVSFGFHHDNVGVVIEYFSVFFENIKKHSIMGHISELSLDRMYEHCLSVLCATRISNQRTFISKEIRLTSSENKTELTEMFMAHWSVFMRYHQGDLESRRAIELLRSEFFNHEWSFVKDSIALIIKQILKQSSNLEQKLLNEFSNVALNVQESSQ